MLGRAGHEIDSLPRPALMETTMPAYNDTTAYPPFTGATAKRDLLRFLWREIWGSCPNAEDIMYRINNSNLAGLTDGNTTYNPKDCFEAS